MLSIEYRYFYQSALDKSFRKAAENLNINSSAVVRQIHKLEDNLQLKLFNKFKPFYQPDKEMRNKENSISQPNKM